MPDDPIDVAETRAKLLDAILPHVVFDGWSETALKAAAAESGLAMPLVRVILPRGAADLAVAYHRRCDRDLADRLAAGGAEGLRYSEKVARAVRLRLEGADREIVRRGAALFTLPRHAPTGARMIWETADTIWRALGDTSDDVNWYSKRAILSGVYSSAVLFWLADESPGREATWSFLNRRIDDVMRFEKFKARVRDSRVLGPLLKGPLSLLSRIRAPKGAPEGMPRPTAQ